MGCCFTQGRNVRSTGEVVNGEQLVVDVGKCIDNIAIPSSSMHCLDRSSVVVTTGLPVSRACWSVNPRLPTVATWHSLNDHMATSRELSSVRLIQGYYWLTPVFLFLSWRYGLDVRVPFLDALPGARFAYYMLSFACAGLVLFRPNLTGLVGSAESTLSVALLIITTYVAYFNAVERAAAEDGTFHNPFTTESLTSLVLSALVFIVSSRLHADSGTLRAA